MPTETTISRQKNGGDINTKRPGDIQRGMAVARNNRHGKQGDYFRAAAP
jgi:hypothetical protein